MLEDLSKFQVFLLTAREDKDYIKTENFEFDWKSFFVNKTILFTTPKNYYFKNLVIEKDFKQWCKEVIWFGRRSNQFKCHPEQLQERKPEVELPRVKF